MKLPSTARTSRSRQTALVAAALLAFGAAGCSRAEPGVVAYVGDEEIRQSQVDQAISGLSSIVEPGQSVSVEAVVNALIQGELAAQVAQDQKIALTDADRIKVLQGTNLVGLIEVADARPVVEDVADQSLVAERLGSEAYLNDIKGRDVTLNPRYGVLDGEQKLILSDQSGSLSVQAQPTETP